MPTSFLKDPDAVLDYGFDWTDWLNATETITAHTITVDAGITLNSHGEDAGIVTAWISGGTAGVEYEVACRITTSEGRTDERTITLVVEQR